MRPSLLAAAVLVAVAVVLVPSSPSPAAAEELVAVGSYATPLHVTAPAGDDRLYVVEREGRVIQVTLGSDGTEQSRRTFADISGLVGTAGEGGLLSIAFSPDYASDRRVWFSYTNTSGDSVVSRYTANSSGTAILTGTRATVLTVDQPASNHNGGMIAFAPDGMLLVGLGDGGGSGDTYGNGQDITNSLLGSILRIDVKDRAGTGYAIPSDNPFVGRTGDDEIWIYGVRNPWRFSVDPVDGDVWIGDVGQGAREEVDRVPYEPSTAVNLGWPRYEGSRSFDGGSTSGLTFPVYEYGHGSGDCSITGGAVQRGPSAPAEAGQYVFADFCSGRVWSYDPVTDRARQVATLSNVFGSGQDAAGDVYVTTASTVYRVEGSGTRFVDVPSSSVFLTPIEAIADAGITRGCDPPANRSFCPTDPVTREQMAAFIRRAEGLPAAAESFRDVAADDVFANDIGAIAEAGITRGCNPPANDRFCPDSFVTREQMAAFLRRALDLPAAAEGFVDVPTGNPFAADIGAIQAAGITLGCNPPDNDRFCPGALVTREQMAAFIARAWDL